jgi:hypothetical protein
MRAWRISASSQWVQAALHIGHVAVNLRAARRGDANPSARGDATADVRIAAVITELKIGLGRLTHGDLARESGG